VSQQYPQQQPGWAGQPTQPQWQAPQPPKKRGGFGKVLGFGCLGFLAVIVVIVAIGAAVGGGKSSNTSSDKAAATTSTSDKPAAANKPGGKPKSGGSTDSGAKTVEFKVWGTAPAGDLGPLDITYGSDSDTRKGAFKNGQFTATLPLNDKAMFYQATAQLQGSGDINCSVTVDGKTKTGHASGGYNICSAQLSSDLFGGWTG
jgi:hypothetical protein